MGEYFPVHAHSEYSVLDGMGGVKDMVYTVLDYEQPGLSLTDHGNMAGGIELYQECQKHGLAPFPGSELYIVRSFDRGKDEETGVKWDERNDRYHLGVLVLDEIGWKGLIKLSSMSHQRDHFHRKPLISISELLEWGETYGPHVAITTGCYFGWVIQHHLKWDRDLDRTTALVEAMHRVFPHTFVEIQNHNIDHGDGVNDTTIAMDLLEIATRLDLHIVAGQDSHYCTEMSEPLLMADLSYEPIGEVVVGDEVLGWHRPEGKQKKVATAATVTHVMHREAEAVRMTFESGATVVCTPDHNWMRYREWKQGYDRWGPLSVGDEAVRVTMPRQVPEGMERDAGWLGGMYDGEGSRQGIAQSYTANPEVCDRIEWTLQALGFNYAVQDNGAGTNVYRIKGGEDSARGLSLWTDFINIAQPVKHHWITDRVIGRRLSAMGPDRIVSIEPVGIKTVVSLTTTTGNYISAGLASKNCDAEEQPVHDMMKKIAYKGGNGEDSKFPGDGFHLASDEWVKAHHEPWWDRVREGHDHLLDLNDLALPALDNYRFRIPPIEGKPLVELIKDHPSRSWLLNDPVYEARANYELSIIRQMGFDGYFEVVADYSAWCRRQGIFINARGSANGSLICFLLGITNVDPIVWDVQFERFLSLDRLKPPDIDMDIESDRRDDVVDYLKSRFPSLVQIGTWQNMGITEDDEYAQKGSLFVQWHAAQNSRGEEGDIPPEELDLLRKLDKTPVRKSVGAHAGGFVLPGADLAIEDYLATMLIASSNTTVTQAPMDPVEDAGYTKLDLLGLRSLSTVRRTMEMIGKDPVRDGMDWIPQDDRKACVILRSGKADNGVFQYEGYATARGARMLKPANTADTIVGLALFRPALMNGGQTERYLAARKTGKREHIHPTVDDLFDDTLGVPIWQEQVLDLMKRVGLGIEDRNAILKAVKSSNERIGLAQKTFNRVHPIFVQCAMDNLGVTEQDGEKMWATVMEFSDYGFNKAHATAYGLLSYRTAFLKVHHPTEFMAATLDVWAGTVKEPKYIEEAHKQGMTIHRPHINRSTEGWSVEGPFKLRRGFRSIKGVGPAGAVALAELGPFESLEDLCQRVPGRALPGGKKYLKERVIIEGNALGALYESGALDSLPDVQPKEEA